MVRNINKENYPISFSSESDGTKKLFASLPILMIAIAEGRLVIIDELDAKLHPKLLRYIISLFTNKDINKNGAQLIFTSHDMSTMKNDVFRRDEIWFAALDTDHSSELYSLYEIRKEDGRKTYLDKKNMYLTRNDYDHNSFIIYIETINEVYDRY